MPEDAAAHTIYLADYQPYGFVIDDVQLTFRLNANRTIVHSRIAFRPNPETTIRDFYLDGLDLDLLSATIDGQPVTARIDGGQLRADVPDGPFVWEAEVAINPAANTALEGLYMSGGMYCTQCEAEGFRKITYYPDRPDVMATFTVRIEGDMGAILSNGNPTGSGPGWAEWHDPWPKPAYLFALVAGDLVAHSDQFKTASGRDVALNIYVRPGDEAKCDYAMDALIRSMRWDEQVYGREYDLDLFNIVAVDDFNMGAMENKGLNIFNSKYVLASPQTATDTDYELIEGIIAHEYFHNWTGNRITCRDWFQLCLKEGLTVFRDQQFSGDMRSHAVKKIDDVLDLRGRQFREDNGPLAHPVRPESFVEINNFYTATVYEKGAQVIGMLKTLVGDDAYARALDLYFERHDGDATTIEAWLKVFEDTTGRDLSQFALWYSQAGTPRLHVTDDFADGTYSLTLRQELPDTPGQSDKAPMLMPITVGLLADDGREILPSQTLELQEAEQSFKFEGLASKPVPSILRNFSAPVILERPTSTQERAFLMAHDTDPFNKWEAARALAKDALIQSITDGQDRTAPYLEGLGKVLNDTDLDPAYRALMLAVPSEDDLAQSLFDAGTTPDPTKIHAKRQELRRKIAQTQQSTLLGLYEANTSEKPYSPDAQDAGKRALRNGAMAFLSLLDGGELARVQFETADNMTDQMAALIALVPSQHGAGAVSQFYDQWRADRLVIDKWFTVQTAHADPERALAIAKQLEVHKDFNAQNPNRLRALLNGVVYANPAAFHSADGAGYRWFGDWIKRIDPINQQVAARATTLFETWRRYDPDRQGMIRETLQDIGRLPNLSRDTSEMVTRILG